MNGYPPMLLCRHGLNPQTFYNGLGIFYSLIFIERDYDYGIGNCL